MSTGIVGALDTFSKSSATLRSPALLETRSVISVISRSRETGAVTRRRRPVLLEVRDELAEVGEGHAGAYSW